MCLTHQHFYLTGDSTLEYYKLYIVANCPDSGGTVPIFLPLSRFFLCPANVPILAAKDQTFGYVFAYPAKYLAKWMWLTMGVVASNLREFHAHKLLVSLFPDSESWQL
jgi:hypothetical protein